MEGQLHLKQCVVVAAEGGDHLDLRHDSGPHGPSSCKIDATPPSPLGTGLLPSVGVQVWLFLLILFSVACMHLPTLEEYGMPLIVSLQGIRSRPLDAVVKVFSMFGMELFVVLIPLCCYWAPQRKLHRHDHKRKASTCTPSASPLVDSSVVLGVELFMLLIYTWYLNSVIKSYFARPRPWSVSSSLIKDPESSGRKEFSFPSGHSWAVVTYWLYLHHRFKHKYPKITPVAIFIVGLASFSRVYFGVHYPHDVVCGWICGVLFFMLGKQIFLSSHAMVAKRIRAFLTVSLLVMATIAMSVDSSLLDEQMGLMYCPGAVLGFLVSPFLGPHTLTSIWASDSWKQKYYYKKEQSYDTHAGVSNLLLKQVSRVIIGILGALGVFIVFIFFWRTHLGAIVHGFCAVLWIFCLAPTFFSYVQLH